ncbi:hypothetical protein MKW94_012337, partial [Papaver nudicaule]|nr:hypothetical protein [Papaver nudicaule]
LEMYRGETRSFLRGIDVNRMPQKTLTTRVIDNEEEEEGGNSSPNSTLSSLSGKRSLRDLEGGEENYDMERACSRGISDEEDGGSDNPNSRNSNKKLRLSKDQSALLEDSFKENNTLNP